MHASCCKATATIFVLFADFLHRPLTCLRPAQQISSKTVCAVHCSYRHTTLGDFAQQDNLAKALLRQTSPAGGAPAAASIMQNGGQPDLTSPERHQHFLAPAASDATPHFSGDNFGCCVLLSLLCCTTVKEFRKLVHLVSRETVSCRTKAASQASQRSCSGTSSVHFNYYQAEAVWHELARIHSSRGEATKVIFSSCKYSKLRSLWTRLITCRVRAGCCNITLHGEHSQEQEERLHGPLCKQEA